MKIDIIILIIFLITPKIHGSCSCLLSSRVSCPCSDIQTAEVCQTAISQYNNFASNLIQTVTNLFGKITNSTETDDSIETDIVTITSTLQNNIPNNACSASNICQNPDFDEDGSGTCTATDLLNQCTGLIENVSIFKENILGTFDTSISDPSVKQFVDNYINKVNITIYCPSLFTHHYGINSISFMLVVLFTWMIN